MYIYKTIGVEHHFLQYYRYIIAVCVFDRESQSNRRKSLMSMIFSVWVSLYSITWVSYKGCLYYIFSVSQSLLYHLSELRGMSQWYDRFGILGMSTKHIQETVTAVGSFVLKTSELQQYVYLFFRGYIIVTLVFIITYIVTTLVKVTFPAINMWPYKRVDLLRGQFSSILLSQWVWNMAWLDWLIWFLVF
jgi:hypothetical protein